MRRPVLTLSTKQSETDHAPEGELTAEALRDPNSELSKVLRQLGKISAPSKIFRLFGELTAADDRRRLERRRSQDLLFAAILSIPERLSSIAESKSEPEPIPDKDGPQPAQPNLDAKREQATAPTNKPRWQDIKVRFTSDFQVQITTLGFPDKVQTYVDLGFEDGRKGRHGSKPTEAWVVLTMLARREGKLALADLTTKQRPVIEKCIQTLRKKLRSAFEIPDNPVSFDRRERSYETTFRISYTDYES